LNGGLDGCRWQQLSDNRCQGGQECNNDGNPNLIEAVLQEATELSPERKDQEYNDYEPYHERNELYEDELPFLGLQV
jgi:hypothetical protein